MMEPRDHKAHTSRRAGKKKPSQQTPAEADIADVLAAIDITMQELRNRLSNMEKELLELKTALEADEEHRDPPSQVV
jgi:uncharacterized coiled-coil protein SlyX